MQFLWQEKNQQKTPWIRVLQPHAGAGKGFYFVPEIGEEVWVDFENQNAERPYVVGSQYNGKQKSNYHTAGNDKKVIHTRSGTKIILNDAQGSVFIEDSSGNSIHLDGKRKISFNGATLEFNAQKIIMNATESTQITTNDYILNALSKIYVFSNWFKQQINGFVQMFSTKTLIKGAEIVDIEAKEAKLHGTEKMIAHSDKLALVNSKETLEVKGQKKNNFSNKAESINSNPNQKITNVMVEFRPHDGWQGEFGFDWLRIDDGAETTEAKYYDCLEDLASGYEKPTQGDSNTIFENKNEAFLALEKEYEHLVIQRNNNSVLTKYYIPWLNLYPENITNSFQYEPKPPCEAILKVLVDIQDEEPEQIRITFNKEYFIINGKDGTDANPVLIEDKIIGAKRDAGQITVKCIKQFTNRQEIIIYAYPQGSLSKTPAEQKLLRKIAGKIILEPNANTSSLRNRKFLNIVFVKVKTNFFDNIEANSKIGNFDSGRTVGEITMLRNILYQSLVTFKEITKDVRGQEIILNLFDNSDFKQKFDSSGNPIDSDYISMNGELRAKSVKKMRELFNSQTNNKYINDMLIFSLDERGEDFNGIVEEIGKKNAVIVNTRTKETMPHEVLHGLGLYHSHQDFSIVKVNDRTPQSSSVFIPNRLNDKKCLYLASDNSLWTYNGTNYMPYTFKEDRKYIYQNGDVAPTYATDNIMSYNRGVRKSTWRWQWKILKRNTK